MKSDVMIKTNTPTIPHPSPPEFLTPKEAAEILRVNAATLEVWRRTDAQDLPFYRVGRNIYYERGDVYAFMLKNKSNHRSD